MAEHEAARVAAGHDECARVGGAVMDAAQSEQHFGIVIAALGARFYVVQIEVLAMPASGDAAFSTIALEHSPPYRGWDGLSDPCGRGRRVRVGLRRRVYVGMSHPLRVALGHCDDLRSDFD